MDDLGSGLRLATGGLTLGGRALRALARLAADAAAEPFGAALPTTPEALARPEVIDALLRDHAPEGTPRLPRVRAARLPGTDFESSNCRNFLVEVEFDAASEGEHDAALPRTLYAKLPCDDLGTRVFANAMGFWPLECTFCERVARHIPIRVPKVHAVVRRGGRFVLLLENLHEVPGTTLFINRDMARGTTPERAARVLRSFAEMHAAFHDWPEARREALLPARFNTFTAPEHREATRALNAVAISPALRAAPDLLSERLGETCRLAIRHWDRVLEAWYSGPLTLVHGDSHLGNCFEHPAENGPRVGMIDFQAVHWSKGMRDVQYFLINSMEPDVLEKHEAELIDGYLEELARHGVRLGREEAFEQYRAFSFQTLMVGVVPLGLGSLTERDETVRAVTRRSAYAVERLGFREWLDQITSSRTSVSTASSSRPSHSA
ncbi:MAG: phosphotransferase [Myxococcales bacterium]|nr:phosphotransferase [Myxococcales bacterium]